MPRSLAVVIGAASLFLAGAAPPPATAPAASDAHGMSASFSLADTASTLWPVADVGGTAPPAYARIVTVADFVQPLAVPAADAPAGPVVAFLNAKARHLVSEAASEDFRTDHARADATAKVATASLTLVQNGPEQTPWLDVQAAGATASADFSRAAPAASRITGRATFGSLRIAGKLLGGKIVTASGAQPANTVLFQSPTVTITADRQIPANEVTCAPACAVHRIGITVRALDISLHDAPVAGRPVSGDIVLAAAAAW